MAFCKNCGSNIPDGATFCSSCGTPVQNAAQQAAPQPQQYEASQQAAPQPQQYEASQQTFNDETADVQNNKAMAILSYIGILVLIPLFAAKDSKYAKYHARQGLTLFILEVAYYIVSWIIKRILWNVLPWSMFGIYSAVSTILSLCSIFFLVIAIIGIVNAAKGESKELPLIGKIDFINMFKKTK